MRAIPVDAYVPASDKPDQDDVDAAKLASQNFTVPAANVAYEE